MVGFYAIFGFIRAVVVESCLVLTTELDFYCIDGIISLKNALEIFILYHGTIIIIVSLYIKL